MNTGNDKKVCVVGAGIIGLSTAVNIADNVPQAKVTLIADQFSPNTTGDIAAGFWYPFDIEKTIPELVLKWGRITWDYLLQLMVSSNAKEVGVQMVSGYHMFKTPDPDTRFSSIFTRFSYMTSKEMSLFAGDHSSGMFYTSIMCLYPVYSIWLMKRFKEKGGKTIKRSLNSLSEVYDGFDVIVNCAGIGAHKLVDDPALHPIKGHVLKVEAPWVKHFYISGDSEFYIIPGLNEVTLGGTHHTNDWSMEPTVQDRKKIWEECCKLLPSIKTAKVRGEYVGLRPGRQTVRLESQVVFHRGQRKFVVHNYGHGGAGITLHWGCAIEATQLVRNCLGTAKL